MVELVPSIFFFQLFSRDLDTKARDPSPAYPCMARGGTGQLFCRDWYNAPDRPMPVPLPMQEEFGIP